MQIPDVVILRGVNRPNRIAEALQKDGVVENSILVGHWLGGPVIVRMAADYPEFVKGLVL